MKRMLLFGLLIFGLSSLALANSSTDFASSGTLSGMHDASFVSAENGGKGISDALFSSSFGSTVGRSMTTLSSGTWFNAGVANARVQLGVEKEYGSIASFSDSMCHNMVPEPGTLGLLGTGLVGLAGALRLRSKKV